MSLPQPEVIYTEYARLDVYREHGDDLPRRQRQVYRFVAYRAGDSNRYWWRASRAAEELGMAREVYSRALKALIGKGLVEVIEPAQRGQCGRPGVYALVMEPARRHPKPAPTRRAAAYGGTEVVPRTSHSNVTFGHVASQRGEHEKDDRHHSTTVVHHEGRAPLTIVDETDDCLDDQGGEVIDIQTAVPKDLAADAMTRLPAMCSGKARRIEASRAEAWYHRMRGPWASELHHVNAWRRAVRSWRPQDPDGGDPGLVV